MLFLWSIAKGLGIFAVAAAGAVGAVWAYLKRYGNKLIDARFEKDMASFRIGLERDLQKELERNRLELKKTLNRNSKLSDLEFDVLPKAWKLLLVAYADAINFAKRVQSHPDLNRLNSMQLREFIDAVGLMPSEVDSIMSTPDKTRAYIDIETPRKLRRSQSSAYEFNNYLIDNGIFIEPNILANMRLAKDKILAAVLERQLDLDFPTPGPGRFKAGDDVVDTYDDLRTVIEGLVRARLWLDERTL